MYGRPHRTVWRCSGDSVVPLHRHLWPQVIATLLRSPRRLLCPAEEGAHVVGFWHHLSLNSNPYMCAILFYILQVFSGDSGNGLANLQCFVKRNAAKKLQCLYFCDLSKRSSSFFFVANFTQPVTSL